MGMVNEFRRRDGSRVRAIQWTGTESAADMVAALGGPLPERVVVPIDGFPVLVVPGVVPFAVRPGHWLVRREDGGLERATWGNEGISFPPYTQPAGPVGHRWAGVQDEVLVELTDVAEEIASSIQGSSDRVVAAAYRDLAAAATRLLLIRHGNERLRELQPAVERPAKRHAL